MPSLRKRTANLAVNGTVKGLFNNELNEYLSGPHQVVVYAKAASNAATAITKTPKITINIGGALLVNGQDIPGQFGTSAATFPNVVKPDDQVWAGIVAGGRVVVDYLNDADQAVNLDTVVDAVPI